MKNYQPERVRVTTRKAVTFLLTFIMLICSTAAFAQTAPQAPKRHAPLPLMQQQRQKKQQLAPAQASKAGNKSRSLKKEQQKATPQQLIASMDVLQKIKQQKSSTTSLKAPVTTVTPRASRNYTYSVTSEAGNAYGYNIFNNGKRIIHQGTIPAVAGKQKFTSRQDAEKVARLVTSKMQDGYHKGLTAQDVKGLNVAVK